MNPRLLLISFVLPVAGLLFLTQFDKGQAFPALPTPTTRDEAITTSDELADVPCLLALAQNSVYGSFDTLIGCYSLASIDQTFSRDQFGRINGVDIDGILDTNPFTYTASATIERDQFGRVGTYTGTVQSQVFPTYVELLTNEYDQFGRICGVDVLKTYTEDNQAYAMRLQPCRQGTNWIGYRVAITGGNYVSEPFQVGMCTTVLTCPNEMPIPEPTPTPWFIFLPFIVR